MAIFGANQPILGDNAGVILGLYPVVPNSSTPAFIDMKGVQHVTAIVTVSNSTGVTGSAITVNQSASSNGSSSKAVVFTKCWANTDTSAGNDFTETTVSSNTFTTAATSNKKMLYLIDIDVNQMDIKGGYRYMNVGTGNSTAATIGVIYLVHK